MRADQWTVYECFLRLDLGWMLASLFELHSKIKWHKIKFFTKLHHCHRIQSINWSTNNKGANLDKVSFVTTIMYIPEADHQRTDVA
jgi:hypothetical protein